MNTTSTGNRLILAKKQRDVVVNAVDHWRANGLVDEETSVLLSQNIQVEVFDWRRTARYSFVIAMICIVSSVSALLADKILTAMIRRIFDAPDEAKLIFFSVSAALAFSAGSAMKRKWPLRIYRNEALMFIGVMLTAAAVAYLGKCIDSGTGHYSLLFLLASVIYALLGVTLRSKLIWIFGLFSVSAWMGTETGYMSGYGAYFLGMNYPLRFVIFGAALAVIGVLIHGEKLAPEHAQTPTYWSNLRALSEQTKIVGLLHLFVALWIMSIFGNYGDMNQWQAVRQYELFHWSVVFGAVAFYVVWLGFRRDDGVLRGFGLTFLFVNLYTRFFEYLWEPMHKAVFFAFLALSFWWLGTKAESIWLLSVRESQSNRVAGGI